MVLFLLFLLPFFFVGFWQSKISKRAGADFITTTITTISGHIRPPLSINVLYSYLCDYLSCFNRPCFETKAYCYLGVYERISKPYIHPDTHFARSQCRGLPLFFSLPSLILCFYTDRIRVYLVSSLLPLLKILTSRGKELIENHDNNKKMPLL